MIQLHPKPYLTFLIFLTVATSHGQFGGAVPDESRAPMSIRAEAVPNCKLALGGNAWVGRTTVKGGGMEVRDLSGVGWLAAAGVLRFQFANGRYSDHSWSHQAAASPITAVRITPKEAQFDGGLQMPMRIEGRVLGVYFADGHVCGELGKHVKSRQEQSVESVRKDLHEAMDMANVMSPRSFQESVRVGLLRGGPYARDTVEATNALLKAKLIGPDGKLISEYKQWLNLRQGSLKPATPIRPKQ